MKKLFKAAALLLLALCVAVPACAAYVHGWFRYTVAEQSVTIMAYTGPEAEVTVPAMSGGNPVNTIASGAFANKLNVTTVYLPDTVTAVEEGAFAEGQTVVFLSNSTPLSAPATEDDATPPPEAPPPEAPPSVSGQPLSPTPAPTAGPAVGTEETPRVRVSSQCLTVNGTEQRIDHYNIGGYNYFKLRDLACLLRETESAFDVAYDAAARRIEVRTGKRYTPLPTDLAVGTDQSATAVVSNQSLRIDGKDVALTAYNIGGNNFFMLRDLAPFLGFGVDYDAATRTAQILTP